MISEEATIMAGVRLEHIFKKYPGSDKATVVDINLDIKDKEFLVLVGSVRLW